MLIFFDFDGTLIDITERWWQLHLAVASAFNLPHYEKREDYILQKRNGRAEVLVMKKIASDVEIIKAYDQERVRRIELPEYLLYDKLFFGTIDTLRALREQGHALVLITKRRSEEVLREQLDRLGLCSFFSNILVTGGNLKLDLFTKNYTAAALKQSIFISDGLEDMATAGQLGMRGIAAGYGCRTSEFLKSAGAKNIIFSLADVLTYA